MPGIHYPELILADKVFEWIEVSNMILQEDLSLH